MDKYTDDEYFEHVNKRLEVCKIPSGIKACALRRNKYENILSDIPKDITYLDISDNLIKQADTERFVNIEVLDLGYNLLTDHDSINNETLLELYLMANDILCISESIKFQKMLKKFDIAANRIKSCEPLKFISETIEEIYLGANKITSFEVDITHLSNLKVLDLQFNNLEVFDCSLLPYSVEILLVNNNKNLVEIKNLEKLKNLKIKDFSDTGIIE